jgi:zinc protease
VLALTLISTSLACSTIGQHAEPSRIPAWELPPPALRVGPIVPAGSLTRTELDNGLQLIVLEDPRLPMVSLGITVRRGAGAVETSHAGLAYFTAELMNRGAGERDALALATAVDDIGATLSVSAGWDSMSVHVSGLSRDQNTLLEILRDVVLEPHFDAEEAQKALGEQLAGLEAAKDNPGTLVRQHAMAALYPGHRYGLPSDGTADSVRKLGHVAARELHAAYFVPNNSILYVSGHVDAGAWAERARQAFGGWKRGPVSARAPAPPSPTPTRRKVVIVDEPDLVQARVMLAHDGIDRTDSRRIAAALMNDTLGGSGFSSRMMKTLRSDAGLTYGVGSGFSLRRHPGPFVVSTFTRVAEVRRAVDILLEEIEAIHTTRPPSDEELAKAKSYNVGQFGLGLETSRAMMGSLVNLAVYDLPSDSLDTYRGRVQAVTAEDVAQAARDLLHPERVAIILLGPADALSAQFEGLAEIIVVEP